MTAKELVEENKKRTIKMYTGFNPLTGEGSPLSREWINISDFPIKKQYVPTDMLKNELVINILKHGSIKKFIQREIGEDEDITEKIIKSLFIIRCRYDFCFWAYTTVKIKPKSGGDNIPFKLKYEQRVLLTVLEEMRLEGVPIRIILLKARQWGGSTLVQIYMAWIQLVHKSGWYSTIVAQTKDVSRKIKAMYAKLLESYPSWMLDIEDAQLEFSPYESSASDFIITYGQGSNKVVARDTVVTIGTYEKPDSTRGGDTALIHYSEVAIWSETLGKKPEDVIRSVSAGLLEVPLTMEVLESTANGTGNYFHNEWERAKKGESNRRPVFIPWFFIEHDSIPVKNEIEFAQWLLDNRSNQQCADGWLDSGIYYWYLWEQGATFQGINWYRIKRKSFSDHADMASEAPSNDIEAFKHSGKRVFDIYNIEELRKQTKKPKYIGDVYGKGIKGKNALIDLKFKEDHQGILNIWELPETDIEVTNRYLAVVDIGGRSKTADYSVIVVFDRFPMTIGGKPEVVAEWYGHIDHDRLAWKAAQIAQFYNKALLVIESNTLETKDKERDTEGEHSEYILNKIGGEYSNLYARSSKKEEDIRDGAVTKWGFHTNTNTKPLIIDNLVACTRDKSWIERNSKCCDELACYEKKQNGSYGAISGHHDDILMTRAIGLYIALDFDQMPKPKIIEKNKPNSVKRDRVITEALI